MEPTQGSEDVNTDVRATQTLEGIRDFFPFLYKLFMIANKTNHSFLRWSADGTAVHLEYMSVQDYLMSKMSIFHEKSMAQFHAQLVKYEFTRTKPAEQPTSPPDIWLQYQHESFQRGRPELLNEVKDAQQMQEYVPALEKYSYKVAPACIGQPSAVHHERRRLRGDICSMICGTMSRLEQTRLRVHMHLRFLREQRLLRCKIETADLVQVKKVEQKGSRVVTRVVNEPVIELPENKFESPLDTVLKFEEGYNPKFAGFYGITDMHKISQFFGSLLPKYEGDRIVINSNVSQDGSQKPCDDNMAVNFSDSDDGDGNGDADGDGEGDGDDDGARGGIEGSVCSAGSTGSDAASGKQSKHEVSIEDEIESVMNKLCGENDAESVTDKECGETDTLDDMLHALQGDDYDEEMAVSSHGQAPQQGSLTAKMLAEEQMEEEVSQVLVPIKVKTEDENQELMEFLDYSDHL